MTKEPKLEFIETVPGEPGGRLGLKARLGPDEMFWRRPISAAQASFDATQRFFDLVINLIVVLGGILAVVAFVWQNLGVFYEGLIAGIFSGNFWHGLNFLGAALLFWFFLYYRLARKRSRQAKIKSSLAFGQTDRLGEVIEISRFFSPQAKQALDQSCVLAKQNGYQYVWPLHLARILLETDKIKRVIGRAGVSPENLKAMIDAAIIQNRAQVPQTVALTPDFAKAIFEAYREAYLKNRAQVDLGELLVGVTQVPGATADIFYNADLAPDKVGNVVAWLYLQKKLIKQWRVLGREAGFKSKRGMNRALTARPTPLLDMMSEDLTLKARYGALPPLVNWEKEIRETIDLMEKGNGNVILVGEEGVGKPAIVTGIAQLMAAENVPAFLQDLRVVRLNVGALVAGAGSPGAIEGRLQNLVREITLAGNIVLYVPDIEHLAGTKTEMTGDIDALNILGEALAAETVHVIGTCNLGDFRRHLENHPAVLRYFKKEEIKEMDRDAIIQVVEGNALMTEAENKVLISYPAVEAAVDFSDKYIHELRLPRKAIDLLGETALMVSRTRGANNLVTAEDVAQVVSEKTKVKVTRVTAKESKFLLRLEDKIHERIVNQEEAVKAVADAIRRNRAQVRSEKKPIVNLLFIGPTGVGKTELAKTTARVYFGEETEMVRLDMSEYQTLDSIKKIIGAPATADAEATPGYLTEAVKHAPASIVLLDEFEKAHPSVINIFLQVMDDARLTDARGHTVDFTNTIIVATSNAATAEIQEAVRKGEALDKLKARLTETTLKEYFRPELLNRFDGIILFKPLSPQNIEDITKIMLAEQSKQLEETRGVTLEATSAAIAALAEKGFDPTMGARPLKRVIQEDVNNALARFLLTGRAQRGQKIILDTGGKISIS